MSLGPKSSTVGTSLGDVENIICMKFRVLAVSIMLGSDRNLKHQHGAHSDVRLVQLQEPKELSLFSAGLPSYSRVGGSRSVQVSRSALLEIHPYEFGLHMFEAGLVSHVQFGCATMVQSRCPHHVRVACLELENICNYRQLWSETQAPYVCVCVKFAPVSALLGCRTLSRIGRIPE